MKNRENLCIAYDADSLRDGLGAQTLRQIGIYCIAKQYGVGYFQNRIVSIDSNPGDGITSSSEMDDAITKTEEFFGLDKISCLCKDHPVIIKMSNLPKYGFLLNLKFRLYSTFATIRNRKYLILIPDPKNFLFNRSELYENFRKLNLDHSTRIYTNQKRNRRLKIAIHVHWAMFGSVSRKAKYKNTYLTLDSIDKILESVTKVLVQEKILFEIEIYSAVPIKDSSWSPTESLSKETLGAWQKTGISDTNGKILMSGIDFVSRYSNLGSIKSYNDLDMFSTWEMMRRADVLLINRSTFSYLAGLLCKQIVLCPKFHHPPLKNWILVPESSEVESEINFEHTLRAQIKGSLCASLEQ